MITKDELAYAKRLVAAMSFLNISRIPFGNDRFQRGMDRLAQEFFGSGELDEEREKVSMLFIKKPITGTYDRMMEALQYLNGYSVSFSFQNPKLETTEIKVPFAKAKELLNTSSYSLTKDYFVDAARAFCKEADLQH